MARSTVRDDRLMEDVAVFSHAVLSYVDRAGYPMSVATEFQTNERTGRIVLKRPMAVDLPPPEVEVNVTFSHVRPQPGVGYDQRRYITLWGKLIDQGDQLAFVPERSHGWDEERLSFFELCERSVPVAHEYMRKLSAETGREVRPQLPLGWLIFLATRVPFLTATIVPVVLGAVVARSQGFSNWWLVALAFVGAAAIHLGLNVLNDVSDATSGADAANVNPTMFSGGSRVIQYGLVSLKSMRIAAASLYAVGIAIGIYLAATRGIELLWIGMAGVFLSVAYSAPPFRLVHRGLGELCVALGFGPIMVVGSYYVVAQRWSWEAFYASLPVALLIMLVLYVNQIPDRPADAKAGKATIVVRLPKEAIVAGYGLSVALTYLLILIGAATGLMPVWTLLGTLTIPIAYGVYRALDPQYEHPYALMGAMGRNVMLHFVTGLLLIAGYVLEIVI